jgi:DNA primase
VTAPSPITAAKQRHRLADVAARTGIPLTAAAGTVTVACPMPAHGHPDRTPSMRLYLDDDRYYCFGCHAHGDVIQWVQDAHQTTITDAIATLTAGAPIRNHWAGRTAGDAVVSPRARTRGWSRDPQRSDRERLRRAMSTAWAVVSEGSLHAGGVTYLARRGIDLRPLEQRTGRAEVGHTPRGADGISAVLLRQGFTQEELIDVGLARPADGRLLDVFRDRVLIPVRDERDRVCGLVGRSVGRGGPKYLNSPRTAIYDKSVHLYRPLRPTDPSRSRAVVVEGTIDALAVTVAAINGGLADSVCPVTQSGRELSTHQLKALVDEHPGRPFLMLDADSAGREAASRLNRAFAAAGRPPVRVDLPDGEDPASWLARHGPEGLARLLQRPSLYSSSARPCPDVGRAPAAGISC